MLPPIRAMQGRDVVGLTDLFEDKVSGQFEDYYLEHLQKKRSVLVAVERDDEGLRTYFGYVTIIWESPYTHFWRRNIPEIADLNVAIRYRNRGIGTKLIRCCEDLVQDAGYPVIGISVQQNPEFAAANRLYPRLGYVPDGFGITLEDNEMHLIKRF